MTQKMEREVKRIRDMQKALETERKAILDMPVDAMTEEEEDALFDALSASIEQTITAEYDAQVVSFRPNEWAQTFLSSFSDCKSKPITLKQAGVFERMLPFYEQKHCFSSFHGKSFVNGCEYMGEYKGKIYKLSLFSNCAYLTIRDKVIV